MPIIKYPVSLSEDQIQYLNSVSRNPNIGLRQRNRARILLRANDGLTDSIISKSLSVSMATVGRIRKRFVEEGVRVALNERSRPGQERKLDAQQEQKLLKLIQNAPPQSRKRWTLRLLASHVSDQDWVDTISHETIRTILCKFDQSLTTSSKGAQ